MKTWAIFALVLAGSAASAAPRQESANGVWQNPSGSVRMRIAPCGKQICGKVVYANAQARADAARGGNPDFIGVNLLRDFNRTGPASWSGQVFVPDINRTVSGTLTKGSPRSITVRGCVVGRVGCRDQVWTKVG
jgi:uncharacterized protein (DUF2147 family)